ncbi:MAG: M81 family metallopeptidase [Deltaproteobacteria bacterium]|nr:M81 family metallopeptidase [Deltaproteobacteria bacterium]
MTRRLRLAFFRISQETNALSPVRTEVEDFRQAQLLEGEELLRMCGRWVAEAPGFLRNAELSGFVRAARELGGDRVELVPLFSAWAVPGGKLSARAQRWFCDKLEADLRAVGPVDGVFFSMHGAMGAEGDHDPEAAFLRVVRGVVGPDVPVAVTMDLHAHLSASKVDASTIIAAYRTNPHRDHARVGYRAGAILVRTVLGEVRPQLAWRTLPMVLGGGTTMDFLPTMRPLFRAMRRMERDPRVLYVSLFMCHLWNDSPDLGWATCVVTDGAPQLGERLAEELADAAWGVRHRLPPHFPSSGEAIRAARRARVRRRLGTVCISDASDMVGAGATGENTRLVKALLEEGKGLVSFAPIRDAVVVEELWGVPLGSEVSTWVGGKLAPEENPPLQVRGVLRRKEHTRTFGRAVVVDADHLKLVVTEGPPLAMRPSFYKDLGLRPWKADICVVKSLFPFRLYFALLNRKTIYARTRGNTDLDAYRRLTFDGPVHPKDVVADWREADRRRRGAT